MGMKHSTLVKENYNNNICFTVFMAMLWSSKILLRYVRALIMHIPYIWPQADLIIRIAFVVFFLFSFKTIIKEICVKELFIVLIFYAVFFLYYFIFPLNQSYYIEDQATIITESFPMFLVGILAFRIERERMLKVFTVISSITIVTFLVYMIAYETMSDKKLAGGDMHAAYMLLPHICLVFYTVILKPNPWNIAIIVIGIVTLLFLGNRGSLLCLSTYAIFIILFSGKLKRPILFLALSVAILVVLFAFGVLNLLYDFAEQSGFSLRIFDKMKSGEITNPSGRDKIRDRVVEYIMLYPMMGMGIFSDRRVAGGLYAHNFILEIIIHYGFVLGILLFGIILYLLIASFLYLRKKKEMMTLGFLSALIFSFFVKLFLSSSYLVEPYFFFTMGFAYAAVREWKNTRTQTKKLGNTLERVVTETDEEKNEDLCDCYQFSMVRSSCSETD